MKDGRTEAIAISPTLLKKRGDKYINFFSETTGTIEVFYMEHLKLI